MKLNILISAHNERVAQVASLLLPPREDVTYILSYQYSDNEFLKLIPSECQRGDVKIYPITTMGLSNSRNNAIRYADGDIAIIADSDVAYTNEYIDTIIDVFSNNADTDVALFKIRTEDDEPPMKRYPLNKVAYRNNIKGYYPSSVEIAFRVSKVKGNILFDERFGLGSEFLNSGEEEIFIKDCLKKGLSVYFYPHYVVKHPYLSSGRNYLSEKNLRSRGAVSSYLHGYSAYLRMVKFAIFATIRKRANIFNVLKNTMWGIVYQMRTRKQKVK